jgi:hypothetical protein
MNTLTETSVRLFASAQSWIEGEAVRQLYATAKLDGVRLAVGFPDLHPGKGTPVGAAFVTEGVIYPHLIGGDIGCGMALFKTDLVRRDAKLDRWAKLQFNLEHPWDQFASDFLAEHNLESTEFDAALGTIGGGNHFAELQTVEKVLDADEFKKLNLGKQQLVVLVHSGSRGLGESILRAHVDQHFGDGVEADSFAAEEYLRSHDFAVRWAKANRELIARRFIATLGAEAECLTIAPIRPYNQPCGMVVDPETGFSAYQSRRVRAARKWTTPPPNGPVTSQPIAGVSVMVRSSVWPVQRQTRKRGVAGQTPARLNLGLSARNNSASRASAAISSAHSCNSIRTTWRNNRRWRRPIRSGLATR